MATRVAVGAIGGDHASGAVVVGSDRGLAGTPDLEVTLVGGRVSDRRGVGCFQPGGEGKGIAHRPCVAGHPQGRFAKRRPINAVEAIVGTKYRSEGLLDRCPRRSIRKPRRCRGKLGAD